MFFRFFVRTPAVAAGGGEQRDDEYFTHGTDEDHDGERYEDEQKISKKGGLLPIFVANSSLEKMAFQYCTDGERRRH
jgi:hypothetical protein